MQQPNEDSDSEYLQAGDLARFVETLNADQRAMWTRIRRAWKREVSVARQEVGGSGRNETNAAISSVLTGLSPHKLEALIDNAVKKGDAQMFKLLAQMGGFDLTEKAPQEAGPGAEVIIIREWTERGVAQ